MWRTFSNHSRLFSRCSQTTRCARRPSGRSRCRRRGAIRSGDSRPRVDRTPSLRSGDYQSFATRARRTANIRQAARPSQQDLSLNSKRVVLRRPLYGFYAQVACASGQQEITIKGPDKYLVKVTASQGITMQGIDGTVGWIRSNNVPTRQLAAAEMEQIQANRDDAVPAHQSCRTTCADASAGSRKARGPRCLRSSRYDWSPNDQKILLRRANEPAAAQDNNDEYDARAASRAGGF